MKHLSQQISEHMLNLGLAALSHATYHCCCKSENNNYWGDFSATQATHAAEILIKARITQEHPLLIFEEIPNKNTSGKNLDINYLIEHGKSIQYQDLPDRLRITTGVTLSNIKKYREFGKIRNSIQHFLPPIKDYTYYTLSFIFEVIDPFINGCWGLCAADFNDGQEAHIYMIDYLLRSKIVFNISENTLQYINGTYFINDLDNDEYKDIMLKKISKLKKQK